MPKWSKGTTTFEVAVNYSDHSGYQATIPKPIMEKLGNSKRLRFLVRGSRIEVESVKE